MLCKLSLCSTPLRDLVGGCQDAISFPAKILTDKTDFPFSPSAGHPQSTLHFLKIYLFLAVLGLFCWALALSSCGEQDYSLLRSTGSRRKDSACGTWA